jgi:hypothetical protein
MANASGKVGAFLATYWVNDNRLSDLQVTVFISACCLVAIIASFALNEPKSVA